jgi:N-acetylmuramoyl-L-alanine amidase
MEHYFKYLTAICIFTFCSFVSFARESEDFVLVIDPGHGGKDYGAPGSKSREKNINLDVALLFGDLVSAKHPDVKVIFTRKTDKFVELNERANIANRAKANLFISIHANASVSRTPSGAETFSLGLAKTDENLEVAKRENSVIFYEDDYQQKYEGFDPRSSESYIMFEFIQNKYMEHSAGFASMIQNEFRNSSKRTDRGVKQAGFLVLRKTSMPSVLVELGFVSNLAEEEFMTGAVGKQSLANSLYNAFTRYKAEYDRKTGGDYYSQLQPQTPVATTPAPVAAKPETKKPESKAKPESKPKSEPKKPEPKPASQRVILAPDPMATEPAQETVAATPREAVPTQAATPGTTAKKGEIVYKIQIFASHTPLPPDSPHFKGYKISSYVEDGWYKYTYGSTTNINEIDQIKAQIKNDFPEAFTVKFIDGRRIK